jgi:hypothetical protein
MSRKFVLLVALSVVVLMVATLSVSAQRSKSKKKATAKKEAVAVSRTGEETKGLTRDAAGKISVTGHTIKVDKKIRDWVGTSPDASNTAAVSEGEYIWRDTEDDDTGNGSYTYAVKRELRKGCDLREFRLTYDAKNLYFFIKCDRPGDWWAPYRLIGIDTDGAKGSKKGTTILAQGDIDELASDNGCYGEIKVAPELACEYIVGIFSSYKGRVWDANGKLLARKEADEYDTPGFEVADFNWYVVETAIPWKIFGLDGPPAGETWRFVVAIGQQDSDVFREIEEVETDWHGGGGETSDIDGPDPDVYDLAGASKKTQEAELGSFDPYGQPGDPDTFAAIKDSYLTVLFAK